MIPGELSGVCDWLLMEARARKVMVCAADGAVLAHAGPAGALDDAAGEAIAVRLDQLLASSSADRSRAPEGVAQLADRRTACVTVLDRRAALVILFDGGKTTQERVMGTIRRARQALLRSLPSARGPTAN